MPAGMFSHHNSYRKTHAIPERKGVNDKRGCKQILQQHHEDLKHDPERLSTKFIADVAGCSCRIVKKKTEGNPHA